MPRMSQPVEPFQIDQWELCELLYVEAVGNHLETGLLCILMHTLDWVIQVTTPSQN
jgi:hypothetical protein